MTIINRLFASSGSEVIIETLQINVGSQVFYLCRGWDDVTAKDESENSLTFKACGIDIALPARNADGTQDLKFAIGNIDGEVSNTIRDALAVLDRASLTFRHYVSTDLAAPASSPIRLAIKSGYWTASQVQITAGYMNILDSAWPRKRYTLNEHPGLRYLS